MNKPMLILLGSLLCLAGCKTHQVQRLDLLSSIRVVDDGTIAIQKAQGVPFFLRGPDNTSVETLRVRRGEKFVLSDGYHVDFTYRFRGIKEGSVILTEEETSDTRSMGGSVDTKRRSIVVQPYVRPAAQLQSKGAPSD